MFFKQSIEPGSVQKIQERLNIQISNYNIILEVDPNNHSAYYAKAGALMKLFQHTGAQNYIQEALGCYTKAIESDCKNPLYLIDRAACYLDLKADFLAQTDFETAKLLSRGNNVRSIYVRNQINKIEDYFNNKNQLRFPS